MNVEASPEDAGLSSPRLARISRWMRRWVDSGRLPGLLVAVVRDDRLVWFESCGLRDVEQARPVEPDTIYRIYSMTKPITTVAALMLYEEGRFQLDDPVAKFIPASPTPGCSTAATRNHSPRCRSHVPSPCTTS